MFRVMDVTRHRRVETLKGYDRRAKAFRNHAGEGVPMTRAAIRRITAADRTPLYNKKISLIRQSHAGPRR
jgi:hypothetical protein